MLKDLGKREREREGGREGGKGERGERERERESRCTLEASELKSVGKKRKRKKTEVKHARALMT